ncbi:MAG: AraC family transcriptional regulator [Eubacteriales bacterium]
MLDREYSLDIGENSCSVITATNKITESLPFYSFCTGHYYANKGYYTINRILEGFLLIYTVAGRGLFEINGRPVPLEAGSIVLVNCMQTPHQYRSDDEAWESYFLRFGGAGCPAYFDVICGEEPFAIVQMNLSGQTGKQFEDIISLSMDYSPVASLQICRAITEILTGMAAASNSGKKINPAMQNVIRQADWYISKNYGRKITVDEIGQFVHVSPFHLIKIFKKYTGYSLHEYLNIYRISRSVDMLCGTDLRVQEIADAVGFGSVNSFIRSFKKIKGIPPAKFRNR